MVGGATGVAALTLSATIVNRWFTHSSQASSMGILTASSATGQLVFLPLLAAIAQHHGWRPVVWVVRGGGRRRAAASSRSCCPNGPRI